MDNTSKDVEHGKSWQFFGLSCRGETQGTVKRLSSLDILQSLQCATCRSKWKGICEAGCTSVRNATPEEMLSPLLQEQEPTAEQLSRQFNIMIHPILKQVSN